MLKHARNTIVNTDRNIWPNTLNGTASTANPTETKYANATRTTAITTETNPEHGPSKQTVSGERITPRSFRSTYLNGASATLRRLTPIKLYTKRSNGGR